MSEANCELGRCAVVCNSETVMAGIEVITRTKNRTRNCGRDLYEFMNEIVNCHFTTLRLSKCDHGL